MRDGRYLLPWIHLYEKILLVVLGIGSMASCVLASLLNVVLKGPVSGLCAAKGQKDSCTPSM